VTGYDAYTIYCRVKLHFNSNEPTYDYVEKGGRGRTIKQATYQKRNDKYYFDKLGHKYNKQQLVEFLVANFVEKEATWVGDMILDEQTSEGTYLRWQHRIQALTYNYKEDVDNMIRFLEDKNLKFENLFKMKSGYPLLLRFLMQDMISIETFIILDAFLGFMDRFDNEIDDDIIWPNWKYKAIAYKSFLNISNTVKFRTILKEKIISANIER